MADELPTPVYYVILASVGVGALLLVAPFAPPQAAIFGFVALLAIGVSGYFAVMMTGKVLYETADEALPEIPDDEEDLYEEYPVDDDVVDAYLNGEITEHALEQELEDALESEQ